MFRACAARFDVTENFKKFTNFFELNKAYIDGSNKYCIHLIYV